MTADLPLNSPLRNDDDIIYVDLNSCFATIEQQARPMLRGRPVAITNRLTPNACIIAASYEAKALGVKVGMRRREATTILPDLIFAETEPSKYTFVHHKLRHIMEDYSASVTMKSIDEGIIDMRYAPVGVINRDREALGLEIKQRLKSEIGSYMRCNIGIASNRFLAKTAAELHKPDGLDRITAQNQREVFAKLKLTDLPGINTHMEHRLNAVNILTPLEFLDAAELTLSKLVYKSIDGNKWYRRLRGIELDDVDSEIKSIGRQYVLESNRLNHRELEARLLHLSEDVGYRLRSKQLYARGVYVWGHDEDLGFYHRSLVVPQAIHTDHEILNIARKLFENIPDHIRIIGITLYKIQAQDSNQLDFNFDHKTEMSKLCKATDQINHRFGERTIYHADSFGTEQIKNKIPFGSTRYL